MTGVPGTQEQIEAVQQICNAVLTLGEAEKVFAQASGRVADAARQGLEAGLEPDEIERLATENKNLGTMATVAIAVIAADTRRLAELDSTGGSHEQHH